MSKNNVHTIAHDDNGTFIRVGSMKYRPANTDDQGGLVRGKVVRAWKASDLPGDVMKVASPQGMKVWARRD